MKAFGKPQGINWHRLAVGPGPWKEMGELQFQFLIDNGLKPEHFLLEVGCGALRAGVHIIKYLDVGHYFAIDNEPTLLKAAKEIEITAHGLESKKPTLGLTSDFTLSFIPEEVLFDRAWAHSVFTHLPLYKIRDCMMAVRSRLAPDGVFFTTFNEAKEIMGLDIPHGWRKELLTTRYPRHVIEVTAQRAGMSVEFIGDWGSMENEWISSIPGRRQQMLALRKD